MNKERVEVTVDYLMNNRWKMYCVSLVCREVLQTVGFNILYRNEWSDREKDGVCFSRGCGGVLTARRLTERLRKDLAKHVEIEFDLMTGKFYKIKPNPLPSKEQVTSDQLRTELGKNNRQMNILQDRNEAILKRLQERGLSPIDAPELILKPDEQGIHAWTDEAESIGQTPPSRAFTLQRVSFPEPVVALADQTLELVMQGGTVVGVDITPTKVATPLSAEELQAMDWYLDPFKEEDRKALALYGFATHNIARGYADWYTSLSWFKGTLSRCHPGPRPLLTTIHRNGDFFYLGKAPK